MGEGTFDEPVSPVAFIKCECPGRALAPTAGMAARMSEIKPDAIYLSSCMVNAKPGCPYASAEEMAQILKNKTGVEVILGTHDYH